MRFALAATLVLAAGIALTGCGSGGGNEGTAPAGGGRSITIGESEYKLSPATVTIDQPGTYTFKAVNNGQIDHALEVEGQGVEEETETIAPGESTELTVEITKGGEYELYCPVDNHRQRGMEGTLTLGGGGGATGGTTTEEGTTTSGGGYGYG